MRYLIGYGIFYRILLSVCPSVMDVGVAVNQNNLCIPRLPGFHMEPNML